MSTGHVNSGKYQMCSVGFVTLAFVVCLSGCSNVSLQQDVRPDSAPTDTTLSRVSLRAHLDYFNTRGLDGRATGTLGYLRTSAYVSERFSEYGLQPIALREYSSIYATLLHYPISAELIRYGPDTLRMETGVHYYPDGRTNSGSARFTSVLWNPATDVDLTGEAVWLTGSVDSDGELLQIAQRGAKAILIEGPIRISQHARPLSVTQIVRVTPEIRRFLTPARTEESGRFTLESEVELNTLVQTFPVGSAQNTAGMLPGSNPVLRNELVVLAARLDGFGAVNGVALTDGTDLAVGASALLETVRMVAGIQDQTGAFGRTLMFALWSGSQTSQSGMRAFFTHPPWARTAIHTLIYVADAGESTDNVLRLAEEFGITVQIIETQALSDSRIFEVRRDLYRGVLGDDAVEAARDAARKTLVILARAAGEGSTPGF